MLNFTSNYSNYLLAHRFDFLIKSKKFKFFSRKLASRLGCVIFYFKEGLWGFIIDSQNKVVLFG